MCVFAGTMPALSKPNSEMLAMVEFTVHVGLTICEEPSLNHAVPEYCAVLFSLTEDGPLMLKDVNVGGGAT
jgi:hypothetical protein